MTANKDIDESWTVSGLPNVRPLEPGRLVKLTGNALVEVTENPHDGMWIRVRYIECPYDKTLEGSEELVFTQDVTEILQDNKGADRK